jgi:hypothetical protein
VSKIVGKIEKRIEETNDQMKVMAKNQVIAQAPSPTCKKYFDNLYDTIAGEAENHLELRELQTRELFLRER